VGHVDAHVVYVVNVFPAPDVLQYLLVGEYAVGVLKQYGEEAELPRCELQPLAVGRDPVLGDIHGEVVVMEGNLMVIFVLRRVRGAP